MREIKDECVGRSAKGTDCEQKVEGSAEDGVSEVCGGISSTYWVGEGAYGGRERCALGSGGET
jgi:hypothetical protein